MRRSRLFGDGELKALEARIAGSKDDPTGLFNRLVKPKVQEILDWIPRRHELKRAIKPRKVKR